MAKQAYAEAWRQWVEKVLSKALPPEPPPETANGFEKLIQDLGPSGTAQPLWPQIQCWPEIVAELHRAHAFWVECMQPEMDKTLNHKQARPPSQEELMAHRAHCSTLWLQEVTLERLESQLREAAKVGQRRTEGLFLQLPHLVPNKWPPTETPTERAKKRQRLSEEAKELHEARRADFESFVAEALHRGDILAYRSKAMRLAQALETASDEVLELDAVVGPDCPVGAYWENVPTEAVKDLHDQLRRLWEQAGNPLANVDANERVAQTLNVVESWCHLCLSELLGDQAPDDEQLVAPDLSTWPEGSRAKGGADLKLRQCLEEGIEQLQNQVQRESSATHQTWDAVVARLDQLEHREVHPPELEAFRERARQQRDATAPEPVSPDNNYLEWMNQLADQVRECDRLYWGMSHAVNLRLPCLEATEYGHPLETSRITPEAWPHERMRMRDLLESQRPRQADLNQESYGLAVRRWWDTHCQVAADAQVRQEFSETLRDTASRLRATPSLPLPPASPLPAEFYAHRVSPEQHEEARWLLGVAESEPQHWAWYLEQLVEASEQGRYLTIELV